MLTKVNLNLLDSHQVSSELFLNTFCLKDELVQKTMGLAVLSNKVATASDFLQLCSVDPTILLKTGIARKTKESEVSNKKATRKPSP